MPPKNNEILLSDLVGKRVRITSYQRDNFTHKQFGYKAGERGPFDIDRVCEGTFTYIRTINDGFGPSCEYAVIQDDGSEVYGVNHIFSSTFFGSKHYYGHTAKGYNGDNHTSESSFDGRKNGSFMIEIL